MASLVFGAVSAETIAFRGGRVLTMGGEDFANGVVLVRDGKIVAVGDVPDVDVPRDARMIDIPGKILMPGLVDTHSHLGQVSGGDSSGPLHPGVRALDGVNVLHDSMWRARAGGLTTINVMPGSGHLMSGQTIYLKLRKDPSKIEDWLFCEDATHGICGSMKMANGTNSMRGKPFPGTRAKSAAMVRQLFTRAQDYARKKAGGDDGDNDDEGEGSKPFKRDLGLEAVGQILSGERRVQFHTHRHDDIATLLRLSREFGFKPVIQHGTESWMLAEELAAEGIGVSFTLVDSPGGKEEILRMRMDAPALLEKAGVAISINTDDWITDSRLFLRTAAIAVRNGMTREGALRAVTLVPARQLGLDDRVGSIEPGKDADFVILSGDPFSVHTQVLETWVEGQRVYDASNPEHHKYAVGGWHVYSPMGEHDHACWR
ncbi:amidohydrolase [Acidobacteria bacterium Mor1]|nr:amidohydrolase [Acidobacteria bacterium Mor1]